MDSNPHLNFILTFLEINYIDLMTVRSRKVSANLFTAGYYNVMTSSITSIQPGTNEVVNESLLLHFSYELNKNF